MYRLGTRIIVSALAALSFVASSPAQSLSEATGRPSWANVEAIIGELLAGVQGVCCIGPDCCVEVDGMQALYCDQMCASCTFIQDATCDACDATSPPSGPAETGACCYFQAECCVTTPDVCGQILIGIYQGANTNCGQCVDGACCNDDAQCVITDVLNCVEAGGTFFGPASTCDGVVCGESGTCCLPDGGCVQLGETECSIFGGEFLGQTGCDACPETAACCRPQICTTVIQSFCDAVGGIWMQGMACSDDPCDEPTGACCLFGSCLEDRTEANCNDLGGTYFGDDFFCADVCCVVVIDFEDQADIPGGSEPLDNGQVIDDGEFGGDSFINTITGTGFNNGPAIYDTTPGVNLDDPDLWVDQGNALILQQKHYPEQDPPGYFARPNDAAEGGTIDIALNCHVRMQSVDLIDVCADDGEGVVVTLYNSNSRTRTFIVPAGWTSPGDGGVETLLLDTLDDQTKNGVTATAEEDDGFDPNRIDRITFEWDGSGAVDNLEFCLQYGLCLDEC